VSPYLHSTQNSNERYPCSGRIRIRYPSKQAAADRRLRPRGYCDRRAFR